MLALSPRGHCFPHFVFFFFLLCAEFLMSSPNNFITSPGDSDSSWAIIELRGLVTGHGPQRVGQSISQGSLKSLGLCTLAIKCSAGEFKSFGFSYIASFLGLSSGLACWAVNVVQRRALGFHVRFKE